MRQTALAFVLLSTSLAVPGAAAAQGFAVYEHGTCAMGRAGTGVAAPCADGSAMFYNPAGLVGRRGFDVTLGITTIDPVGGFRNDTTLERTGLASSMMPVPHVFLRYGVNDRIAAGVGVFVPYGLGTEWSTSFEGRFVGFDNDLRSVYIQPTVAIEPVPGVRIGAGLDIIQSKVELTQRIDLFDQDLPGVPGLIVGQVGIPRSTEIATARLESDNASAVTGHVGVQVELSERWSVGVRYLGEATVDYEGTVDFTQIPTGIILPDGTVFGQPGPLPVDALVADLMTSGGPLADQNVTTSIPMPAQFVAGFAVKVRDDLTFLADWQFTRWSVFDTLTITFQNGGTERLAQDYFDTHGIRGGLEWTPSSGGTLRVGYLRHDAATPPQTVTPLLPEGLRNEVTFGYSLQATRGVRVDAAYQYIRQDDRRGRLRNPLPGEDAVDLNAGLYQFRAHLFGLTLHLAF